MSATAINAVTVPAIKSGTLRLDPARSSVEFHVRHFYGLTTVKDRYDGTLNLQFRPAIELVIDADSLDTKHGKRDAHLRSGEFFNVANHPTMPKPRHA